MTCPKCNIELYVPPLEATEGHGLCFACFGIFHFDKNRSTRICTRAEITKLVDSMPEETLHLIARSIAKAVEIQSMVDNAKNN